MYNKHLANCPRGRRWGCMPPLRHTSEWLFVLVIGSERVESSLFVWGVIWWDTFLPLAPHKSHRALLSRNLTPFCFASYPFIKAFLFVLLFILSVINVVLPILAVWHTHGLLLVNTNTCFSLSITCYLNWTIYVLIKHNLLARSTPLPPY